MAPQRLICWLAAVAFAVGDPACPAEVETASLSGGLVGRSIEGADVEGADVEGTDRGRADPQADGDESHEKRPTLSVLVTGGAGFIGHHTLVALRGRGIRAVGLDNFNGYYDPALKRARAEASGAVVEGDVCDRGLVARLLEEHSVTHVVHLAAQAGVRYSLERPQAYVRSNVECFVELLEVLKERPVTLVYGSSSSVYGRNTKVPFAEDDPVDAPASLYAATKRCNELLASVYRHLHGLRSVGLRFFTVYGPMGRPDMAYYSFTRDVLAGRTIRLFNRGRLSRDFTYISDIVDGIVACLGVRDFEAEVLNLGRGEPRPLSEFVAAIERATGRTAKVELADMAKGDVLTTFADVSRASKRLGYAPKISLHEGIEKFVAWYRTTQPAAEEGA
jgi:UDP-glucuronate 4-epimerase